MICQIVIGKAIDEDDQGKKTLTRVGFEPRIMDSSLFV
jgi:hypothetical protein